MKLTTFVFAATLATVGLAQAQKAQPATAELKNANGQVVGKVRAAAISNGVRLTGQVMDLPAGEHGIHIHMTGKCDPPEFTSAGGHFNPSGHKHGMAGKGGHEGDLGNLTVGSNGKAKIDIRVMGVSLAEGGTSLFKEGGTALVIHANPDDLKTDPAGNAGARIACGVFMK
jgi:Cu-Zn family superoxide dismutase